MFGPSYQPPRTDTRPHGLRENLKKAKALLEAAGWKVGADGVLRNAKGEPFEFEYLEPESPISFAPSPGNAISPSSASRSSRASSTSRFTIKRLETFDFDMITIRVPDFALPNAIDYLDIFGSKAAGRRGVRQLTGA